ncbi:inorganic phosphate transporter, PiT family [Propionispira arboris]|uniref:Inorganic phosphate transporter, PiT family n=1 Tax=Propionispira arboris TaxID=84035 RepID=A0A1H6XGS6_9FIRM|nr:MULTISPECIES: inorganic phosphate transporter [Propionispira]SEJ25887.1 inorganic phosphate transporter, PiT family [Propionispira arboris]
MHELQYLIFTVIILALVFDFINGFHDTANAIATSVSTRAIPPRVAIIMAAVLNFVGALYSTGVAKTIGGDIVKSAAHVDEKIIIAALCGAIVWNLVTWWFAIPSSSSHALVGGIIGAVLVSTGADGLNFYGIGKIVISLVASPLIAIITGCGVMSLLYMIFGGFSPSMLNNRFKKMQILSAAMMSFSHGSNDAQKAMGIITLALLSGGYIQEFEVPFYIKILAATSMACGTAVGGWKIIKTIGGKIFKLEPITGFAADLNSAIVIFGATLLHLPVSTTHVVSGSIMGVGTAKRIRAVRWGVARQMLTAWILTIPCTALMSAVAYQIARLIFE